MARTINTTYPGHNFFKMQKIFVQAPWLYGKPDHLFLQSSGALDFGLFGNRAARTSDPNWKVLVYKRQDASGYYHRKRIAMQPVVTKSKMFYTHPNGPYSSNSSEIFGALPAYEYADAGQDDADLRDLALARLKRKLSSRTKQMNILVPVVELREFRDLIKSLTFAVTDLMYALVRFKKRKGKKEAAQLAAHYWLNWSFALAPTLSDIKALAQLIDELVAKRGGEMYTDYGAAKREWNSTKTWDRGIATASANSDVTEMGHHKLSYRFVAGYNTPLRSANNYNAMQDFSLEPGALLPTLWELTAFSWLFDYVATVGPYLEDAFVSDGVNTVYVNCTRKYSYEGSWVIRPPKVSGLTNGTSSTTGLASKFQVAAIERTIYSAMPTRALRFKTVDEIGKNALSKLLNLGSILVGGKALSSHFE